SAPFLPQQKEDGGDQRARVSDPDPENEVGDPPSPSDRDVVSPCAHAGGNQVSNAKKSKGRGASSDRERHPPPARRGLLHHTRNALGQPTKIASVQNKRYARDLPLRLFNRFRRCWGCVHVQIANCRLRKICKRRGRRGPRTLQHERATGAWLQRNIDNRKSKIENSSCWFLLQACDSDIFRVRHFRVWIANVRQITCSRPDVQVIQ